MTTGETGEPGAAAGRGAALQAIEHAQKTFDDNVARIEQRGKQLERHRTLLLPTAYGLKLIAAFGCLAVTAGLPQPYSQYVAIAIAVVLVLDSIFSNHTKLVATWLAAKAIARLRRTIENRHENELSHVLEKKGSDPALAQKMHLDLLRGLVKSIQDEHDKIEKALEEEHLKALKNLSLDPERLKRKGTG